MIILLARQSLPFRGNWNQEYGSEQNSNFHQMLLVRAEEDQEIVEWLKRKHNKFTSPDIQNEMIQVSFFDSFRYNYSFGSSIFQYYVFRFLVMLK